MVQFSTHITVIWSALVLLFPWRAFFSYRDQFAMLADGIARERYEMEVREKAQEKVSSLTRKWVSEDLTISCATMTSLCAHLLRNHHGVTSCFGIKFSCTAFLVTLSSRLGWLSRWSARFPLHYCGLDSQTWCHKLLRFFFSVSCPFTRDFLHLQKLILVRTTFQTPEP